MRADDHGRADSNTHYEALCVREYATYAEIRSQYRSALVSLHPDKNHLIASHSASSNGNLVQESNTPFPEADNQNSDLSQVGGMNPGCFLISYQETDGLSENRETGNEEGEILERFLRVQKAWEVLKDVKSREAYDYELQALRHNSTEVIANEIELEEMSAEEGGETGTVEYFYPCRCGDYFVIAETELVEMGFRANHCVGEGTFGFLLNEVGIDGTQLKSREQRPNAIVEGRAVTLPCVSCSLRIRVFFDAEV